MESLNLKRRILINAGIILCFIMLCVSFCIYYLRINMQEFDDAYLLRISWGSIAISMLLFTARSILFGILAYIDMKKEFYRVGTLIIQGVYLLIVICSLVILMGRITGIHDAWKIGERFGHYKMGLALLAVTQGMIQRTFYHFLERFDILKILLYGMIFLLFVFFTILAFCMSLL